MADSNRNELAVESNVLLRRAQFVRSQEMPNVMVLTFTRSLTEFVRTGCYNQGRQIFPPSLVSTLEGWIRSLYKAHNCDLPDRPDNGNLSTWKRTIASGASGFVAQNKVPQYDAIFIDEAQDLMSEEVALLREWSNVLFFVGDDNQRIYDNTQGLSSVRGIVPSSNERTLTFHYRLAPEICRIADRILSSSSRATLSSTCHYNGPRPGRIGIHGPFPRDRCVSAAISSVRDQIRAYAGLIEEGDRIGVIVPRKRDREILFEAFEEDPVTAGKSQIVRARTEDDEKGYSPDLDPDKTIYIITVSGCKGLEFRCVHWLFCDDLSFAFGAEHYYTVVTRAKTGLDLYNAGELP